MNARRRALLEAIQAAGGEWTSGDVCRKGLAQSPKTARADLAYLAAHGHLVAHDESGRRFYTLPGGN